MVISRMQVGNKQRLNMTKLQQSHLSKPMTLIVQPIVQNSNCKDISRNDWLYMKLQYMLIICEPYMLTIALKRIKVTHLDLLFYFTNSLLNFILLFCLHWYLHLLPILSL